MIKKEDVKVVLETVQEMAYSWVDAAGGVHIELPDENAIMAQIERSAEYYWPNVSNEDQKWPTWKKTGITEPDAPSIGGPWGLNHDWDDRVMGWYDNTDYEHSGTFVCQRCHAHYDDPEASEKCPGEN